MILKCAVCNGDMEIIGNISENVKIKCPHCGSYVKMNKPQRIEVPIGANLPRFAPNDEDEVSQPKSRRPDLHVRRPPIVAAHVAPPMPPLPSSNKSHAQVKKKICGGSSDWWVYALLVIVVAGLGIYWFRKSGDAANESLTMIAEESHVQLEDRERQRNDEELKRRQEEKKKRDEAEREKRREEKAKKDAEREKERQEMALKAEQERQSREMFAKAEMSFDGIDSVFALDFQVGNRPFDFAEDNVFIVADASYVDARILYRLTVEKKHLKSVQRISIQKGTEDVLPDDFMRSIADKIVLAKMSSGPVWICGDAKMNELIDVPESEGVYRPLADFTGGILPTLQALKANRPAVKYRISLKAKIGKGDIKFGIVEKEIDLQEIRSKIREQLTDQKLKKMGSLVKPPKMKKIKRTVVFYEGTIMKKEIGGLVKIPRHYVYHVNWQNRTTAEERWKDFAKKAKEEEEEELRVEAENQRRMAEYRSKVDASLQGAKPTESEVDAELEKYRLFIERSRSKLPKE